MSKHNIDDLRDELFDTLKALKDPVKPMDIDRAKAITRVAAVIVDSAKAEVEMVRVTGGVGSGFIPIKVFGALQAPKEDGKGAVTVHRIR